MDLMTILEGWEHKQYPTGLQCWNGPHGVCVVPGVDGNLYLRLISKEATVTIPNPTARNVETLVAFAETLGAGGNG